LFDFNILEKILSHQSALFSNASVSDITAYETMSFNFIFFFKSNEREYILKVMKSGAKNEFSIMKEAKNHIEIPGALSYGKVENDEYLLMERAPGKDAKTLLHSMNLQDKATLIHESARILARLHKSTFNIRKHDKLETSRFVSADDVKAEMDRWGLKEWHGLNALKAMEQDASTDCVLVHGRFIPSNIMVYQKNISGIIDWARSFWASPYYDLGYTLFIMNSLGLDASLFLRSYKEEWLKPVMVDLKQVSAPTGLGNLRELLPFYETLAAIEFYVLSMRIKKDPRMVEIINHPANSWAIKVIESAERVASKLG
jgi:aminoglycoside phosphotransferase (APT) family kinase protein